MIMDKYPEKRKSARVSRNECVNFTVLTSKDMQYEKIRSYGTIVDASVEGIGLLSQLPLQPGYVLQWDDKHQKGNLHIALVLWSHRQGELFRAGLRII